MKPELKSKIEALAAEVVAAVEAGETTTMAAAFVLLAAHREAGGTVPKMSGTAAGMLGAMAGASLFSDAQGGLFGGIRETVQADPTPVAETVNPWAMF